MIESLPQHSESFHAVLRKLEFDKVVEHVSELSLSESGKARALHILPVFDLHLIEAELKKVSEAKELLIAEGNAPLESFRDIRAALKKTTVENQALSLVELIEISVVLRISRSVKTFFAKRQPLYPLLQEDQHQLLADKVTEFHITEALDEHGFVKDNASKELRTIRRSMMSATESLRKKLEAILRHISEKEFVQDDIVTTRDGRLVVPVKAEYKNNVPGFIHSTSASGATVFIEPAESLELNNSVRELQLQEQREIHRILLDLTRQIAAIREPLEQTFDVLTTLDVVFAKGKYSIEVIGIAPLFSSQQKIKLQNARHPILLRHMKREDVVPLSVELGEGANTLVVTGPNAGGKTVALKTIGLLAACAQAGLHIPVASDSELAVFQNFFVDIGDDQSIENDLSTFSSHLIRLNDMLRTADSHSLILLDEIGAGTDPAEGGALAAAILNDLTRRHAITIATTHHGALKVFAHETQGVLNGSMEFDQTNLRPTYRFKSGIPGSSFAFELAERIGIAPHVLQDARTRLGNEAMQLESLLMELERQSQAYQQALKNVAEEKQKAEDTARSYEYKMTQLKRELSVIKKKAAEEARQIVKDAHAKIEHSIQEIRERGADKDVVRSSKQALKGLSDQLQQISEKETVPEKIDNTPIAVGDKVRLQDGSESGEVVEVQGKYATVMMRNARMRVALSNLRKQGTPRQEFTSSSTTHIAVEAPAATTEIDLRGMFGDEAVAQVQTFLDNAYSAGLHRVDIIHGKGTGALRKHITAFLQTYPHVKGFRLGEWNEGGTGVTVVDLS
ncbi:MAG TPA: endonuclease MutS2 [Bacteroidota bacterium]|nr:endonuclease MutS2 [Bacteroidota bacterium]